MTIKPYKEGDVVLLFYRLPFDFHSGELPLDILPNVYLDRNPVDLLDEIPPAEADYLVPGYHAGKVASNCCLRYDASKNEYPDLTPTDLFFISIAALRLQKPVEIKIAGQFEVGKVNGEVKNERLFLQTSKWQPNGALRYSADDIYVASHIAGDLIQVSERESQREHKRITSAIIYFSQVTCGSVKSLQLSYLGLWAALEALFVPEAKGSKGNKLACRISYFLSQFEDRAKISRWIKKEYKERNKLAHGVQDILPWQGTRDSRVQAFGKLHEIARLCILGFLSLDKSQQVMLSVKKEDLLGTKLNALKPASGKYLEGQFMFLA